MPGVDKNSVKQILELLVEKLEYDKINSLLDLTFENNGVVPAAKELGFKDVKGYAIHPVNQNVNELKNYQEVDLDKWPSQENRFDLAVCLESVQNFTESEMQTLIDHLIFTSDRILFSCPIPGQMSEQNLNLKWPEFWAKLFHQRGMVMLDCLRYDILDNTSISWNLRQNVFLVLKRSLWVQKYQQFKLVNSEFHLVHNSIY
ncbi:MAG: hypothetical protein OHK0017_10960 [Patescibacteria group bacterium]